MKFCEECGAQLEDDVMFCDECGTPVSEDVTEAVVVLPEINSEVEPQEISKPKKKINPKLFIGIGAGVVVVALIVVVVILAIKLVQKNDEGMPLVGDDETTSYEVAEKETTIEDVTTEVITTEKPTTEDTTDYTWYEEFIDLVGRISDWPILSEEAMEEYQKDLYKEWLSGDAFNEILVAENGTLYLDLFNNLPYGIFTTVFTLYDVEYGFRIVKEDGTYTAQYIEVYNSNMFSADFEMQEVGKFKTNYSSSIINDSTGETIYIKFSSNYDGYHLMVYTDFYLLVDRSLDSNEVSYYTFDNYYEFSNHLY